MNIRRIMTVGALAQLTRQLVNGRRRARLERSRRSRAAGALGVLAGAGLAWWFFSRGEEVPAWKRKKERREARRADARQRNQAAGPPPEVHVATNDDTGLRVPVGERKH